MARERLEPGARPKDLVLEPTQGEDGIYRIERVRHRRFNGTYTRTSAQGFTRDECLDEWGTAFERKRHEGSARRKTQRHRFKDTDPMSLAFKRFFELTQKRVDAGKITQKTHDLYWAATFRSEGPRADPDAIRLDSEMGELSIAEAGQPVFLSEYLEDVAEIVGGIAEHQYIVLKGTFSMLTRAGLFRFSPMAEVLKPERGEPDPCALRPEERDQLYCQICARTARTPWIEMLYMLILGTGIRPGEAYWLQWSDIPGLDDPTVKKAVLRVGGTVVKPRLNGGAFRQNKRKSSRRGHAYYVTLPEWLTTKLRAYKNKQAPKSQDEPILTSSGGGMLRPTTGEAGLRRAKEDSSVDWVTWGNLRDTVATHITGRTGDARRASAQLGHMQGASMVTGHYLDPNGYVHPVVDNTDVLEELDPAKVGAMLESTGSRS